MRGEYDALVLACAGLQRLELEARISQSLSIKRSLPAVAQGALGIECCADRPDLIDLLGQLNDAECARCVAAERAFSVPYRRRLFFAHRGTCALVGS